MPDASFFIAYAFVAVVVGWTAFYSYRHREHLSEMAKMMVGMVFGTLPSLAVGALYVTATGDYIGGNFLGTAVGLLVGLPMGRLGGGLGRMEGVMAAFMGGMMGSMLGLMGRPFDVRLLVVFVLVLVVVVAGEMAYLVFKSVERKTPRAAIYFAALAIGTLFAFTAIQDFSLSDAFSGSTLLGGSSGYAVKPLNPNVAPVAAQVLEKSQEINLLATFSGYQPEVIKVKRGVPVKINFAADSTAGCSRSIQFPDFGIQAIAQPNQAPKALEFTPQQAGTFNFYCGMRMFRGQLIVEN